MADDNEMNSDESNPDESTLDDANLAAEHELASEAAQAPTGEPVRPPDAASSPAGDLPTVLPDAAIPPPPPANMGFGQPGETVPPRPATPPPTPKNKLDLKTIIGPLIVLGIVGFGLFSCLTKTQADDLKVGDCFAIPGGDEFSNVKNQSCDGPHEAQIYAEIPEFGITPMEDRCIDAFLAIPGVENVELPDDAVPNVITGDDSTTAQCVIASESSGLTESVLGGN